MVSSEKLTQWLSRLVQIPSVNPVQAGPKAGTPGEVRIAAEIAKWFTALGGEVHVEEKRPGRPHVYGIWRGKSDRWAALDVHTDTVTVEQMVGDPFDGRVADGRVYGRGSVDTKASLGVALAILEVMHQAGLTPEPNLLIAATADEENRTQGAPFFAEWVRRQKLPLTELMVAEPTRCHPVYGHKGGVGLEFEVRGVASHSAKPHLGKNAIFGAAHAIMAIEAENERLQTLPPTTEVGRPTLMVSIINGGLGGNVVPDSCFFKVGWRMVPGENGDEVIAHIKDLVERNCPLPVISHASSSTNPFFQSPDTAWIQQMADWSGQEPMTVPYGTNARAYGDLPGECIVLGPGSIDQAHSDVEWVEISELEKLAGIYTRWWGLSM